MAHGRNAMVEREREGGHILMTFENGALVGITVTRQMNAADAAAFRTGLEQKHGKPDLSEDKLTWEWEEPPRRLSVTFLAIGEGYRVVTGLIDTGAAPDVDPEEFAPSHLMPGGAPEPN